MEFLHDNLSRFKKTISKAHIDLFWVSVKTGVKNYIRECEVCQHVKIENIRPFKLLQPLSIPHKP